MQLNGIFTGLFFVLLTQSLAGFSGREAVGPLDDAVAFVGINNEQTMKGLAEARLFVQNAKNAGWSDDNIVTALIDSLGKDNVFSTTSYSLKNDVNHVWFFLGAMAMLGVISVGYIIYWLMQRKQDDNVVPPSPVAPHNQRALCGDGKAVAIGQGINDSTSADDGNSKEILVRIEKELAAVRERVMAQDATK